MATKQENLPAVQTPENALQLVQKHKSNKDLVFVKEEDLRTQTMFVPVVTVIHATQDDFHNISGNLMPKGYQTDRIGHAAGVKFIAENCGTRKEGEDVYVGYAQGEKRLPDGTWLPSSVCEYEFDVNTRAEEDFINDSKKDKPKYTKEIDKKAHILQLKKFARQRAGTGARLKVIRELVGIPISFKPPEIHKAMVFSRVAPNTDLFLSDPELRELAIKAALGASQTIYGPKAGLLGVPPIEAAGALIGAPEEEVPPFNTEPSAFPEEEEIEANIKEMKYYLSAPHLHKEARELGDEELAKPTHELDTLVSLNERFSEWLKRSDVIKKYGPWPYDKEVTS